MTAAPEVDVQAPEVRDDLTAEQYHADKTSISSTGLRALLDPGCPAQFKYDRDHPKPPKREFDIGHAAHKLALGVGDEIVVTEWDDWRTKAARQERDAIRDSGAVPLLFHEGEQVQAMADAIRRHPEAGPLFAPGNGIAERSIFWTDPATGVRVRIRPDWLIHRPDVTVVVDLKTTTDASPDACSRAIKNYAYHQQGALYCDGVQTVLDAADARFVFVFQAKHPPYLITVRELSPLDREIGRARNAAALRLYAHCTATDTWPDWTGPVTDIPQIGMPDWDTTRQSKEYL